MHINNNNPAKAGRTQGLQAFSPLRMCENLDA